jgi:hypothetical protein
MSGYEEVLPETTEQETGLSGGETLVSSGATLMRVEHDAMLAVSVQRPRNPKRILKNVLEELDIVPSLAAENYYSIPYKDRGQTVHVSGPSIHASRSLARAWGNCSAKCVVIGEDEEKIHLAGIFVDLETNVRFERPLTVSRFLKKRDGSRLKLRDDRLMQAILAGASKAERNATLAGLPRWLVQSYDQKVRKLAADTTRQKMSGMVQAFLELGVDRGTLESHIGGALEKATDDQIADLRGIYNAINAKELTPEDAFSPPETEKPVNETSVEDILAKGAETTAGTEKPITISRPRIPKQPAADPIEADPRGDPSKLEEPS